MQVKRRITQFFGILRKEKSLQNEDQEELPRLKRRSDKKSNQSYSKWDLVEHIAVDDGEAQSIEDKVIYSDGLALDSIICTQIQQTPIYSEDAADPNKKSFLKRSGSLFRRSIRNKKKKDTEQTNHQAVAISVGSESITNIVQQINETLLAVAAFDRNREPGEWEESNGSQSFPQAEILIEPEPEQETETPYGGNAEKDTEMDYGPWQDVDTKKPGAGFRNGLRRQASKIVSKFQRTSGSMRLKHAGSIESVPKTGLTRHRSASWSGSRVVMEQLEDTQQGSNFKRKMSFKRAKKAVVKGVSSVGKSVMSASAVMPVAYECPPASFYPDYDPNSPTELEHHYYRTVSYQQRADHNARPTGFYQHGYCYNG